MEGQRYEQRTERPGEHLTTAATRSGLMEAAQTVTTAAIALNTGARIPQVGLGVWQSPRGAATRSAVATALRLGYRHVDTARIYGNEADVGAAVRASSLPREEVFVT